MMKRIRSIVFIGLVFAFSATLMRADDTFRPDGSGTAYKKTSDGLEPVKATPGAKADVFILNSVSNPNLGTDVSGFQGELHMHGFTDGGTPMWVRDNGSFFSFSTNDNNILNATQNFLAAQNGIPGLGDGMSNLGFSGLSSNGAPGFGLPGLGGPMMQGMFNDLGFGNSGFDFGSALMPYRGAEFGSSLTAQGFKNFNLGEASFSGPVVIGISTGSQVGANGAGLNSKDTNEGQHYQPFRIPDPWSSERIIKSPSEKSGLVIPELKSGSSVNSNVGAPAAKDEANAPGESVDAPAVDFSDKISDAPHDENLPARLGDELKTFRFDSVASDISKSRDRERSLGGRLENAVGLNPESKELGRGLLGAARSLFGWAEGTLQEGDPKGADYLRRRGDKTLDGVEQLMIRGGVGMIPVLGDAVDLVEVFTGKDLLTGEDLSMGERLITAAGLIAGSGAMWRSAMKSGGILGDAARFVSHSEGKLSSKIEKAVKNASTPNEHGLSEFGRAMQKKAARNPETWGEIGKGGSEALNKRGRDFAHEVMSHPESKWVEKSTGPRYGGRKRTEVIGPDGRGVRFFSDDGSFDTFLNPQR